MSRPETLTVESFIHSALYDPKGGYYSTRIATVGGTRADFSTAATLSPWLGRAIAAWYRGSRSGISHIVEIGAGSGALGETILHSLGWLERRRMHYHIVDVSGPLQKIQKVRLRRFRNVHWHASMQEALDACGGEAILISNELFDAFPCRRLAWSGTQWLETVLEKTSAGHWRETIGPNEPQPVPDCVALSWDRPPKPGHTIEIQPAIQAWFESWRAHWKRGKMLSIDYGDLFPIVCRSPVGTLRGYFRQQRVTGDDVFLNPGHQDITVDVNFTDLIRWGDSFGWKSEPLLTQGQFLTKHAPKIAASQEPEARYLINPEGMGGEVKVLEQCWGI